MRVQLSTLPLLTACVCAIFVGALPADDAPLPEPTRAELLDPAWIEATLAEIGIDRLIKLYDADEDAAPDPAVQLVQDALMLSRKFLPEHPVELRSQLQARLLSSDEPDLQVFQDLPADRVRARATRQSLWQAGDALRDIFPVRGQWYYFAASPDGSLLATHGLREITTPPFGSLNSIHIRSGVNGELLRVIGEGSTYTAAAGFSPDLAQVYGVSEDGVFHAWDVYSGEELWNGACGFGRLYRAITVSSPDGRYVAVTNFLPQVVVFEAETGAEVSVISESGVDGIGHIAFLDNETLVGCCHDATVRHWDVASGELLEELDVQGWQLTPDATKVVSIDAKYVETEHISYGFAVYDGRTGELQVQTVFDKALHINSMDVDPAGERLILVTDRPDKRMLGYNLSTGEKLTDVELPNHFATHLVATSGDGVLTSGTRNAIHVWDTSRQTNRTDSRIRAGHVEITADGATAMTCSRGELRLWDTETWEETATFTIGNPHSRAVMSDDGTRIMFIVGDEVQLLDSATGQVRLVLKSGADSNAARDVIALSGDGLVGAVNTQGRKTMLFDVDSGEVLATTESASAISLSYDGSRALFGHRLLDRNTGMETAFEFHASRNCDLSDDGRLAIACGSFTGNVVWNVERDEQIKDAAFVVDLPGFSNPPLPVAISGDGRFTASCGPAFDVYLYDTQEKCPLAVVNADHARIRSLDLSADGSHLLVTSEDGALHHYRFENLPP